MKLELAKAAIMETNEMVNDSIFASRERQYNLKEGPRVGDWVIHPEGHSDRITYIWPDGCSDPIQTGGLQNGSYYFGFGYMSYSGSLDKGIDKNRLHLTPLSRTGSVWFFNQDVQGAGRGVYRSMSFRVFIFI